jgi:hypothetical protein
MALEGIFGQLEALGVYDVILPFILIFTVVYAVMQKTHIFEEKRFNVMIALVMGLAVIFPHVLGYYPQDRDVVLIINEALPNVSIVIVAVLMALIIIGVLGKRVELGDNSLSGWIAILAFALVVYIFGSAAEWWSRPGWLSMLDNPDIMALVIVVLVFAIIIWFVTKDESGTNKDRMTGNQFGDAFSKLLKGGGGGGGGGGH